MLTKNETCDKLQYTKKSTGYLRLSDVNLGNQTKIDRVRHKKL